jgi:nicotinamide mononucleotide transporter
MESALNVYYMIMAVYGWQQWRFGGREHAGRAISRWGRTEHVRVIGGVALLTWISGALLSRYTEAAWPYVDSFTTWGSVVTTFMVARKVLENWLYWIVIDSVSIFLYIDRGLYPTALLFAAYLVIVVFGFLSWRRHYAAATG